jgi:putative Ig domain-containing protein
MHKMVRVLPLYVIACLVLPWLAAASQVRITTTTLPGGNVNTPYTATIETAGGSVPFIWLLTAGSLPPGLSLTPSANQRSSTLPGTPTVAATYNFSISVKGRAGHTSTVAYTLTIQGATEHIVDLTWIESGGDIVGYNVYRGTIQGGPYGQINVSLVASTIYTDSGVVDGTTYYYVTTAVDQGGVQSGYSNEAEAQVPEN